MNYNQVNEKTQLFTEHYLGKDGIVGVGIGFDTNHDLLIMVSVEDEKSRELVPDEFLGTKISTQVVGKIFAL